MRVKKMDTEDVSLAAFLLFFIPKRHNLKDSIDVVRCKNGNHAQPRSIEKYGD